MDGYAVRAARLRDYLAADSDNVDLACELADLLAAEGAPAAAEDVLAGLPDTLQNTAAVGFRRARLALSTGRYADASQQLSSLVQQGVDAPAVAHDLAFAQLCLRQSERARNTVNDAVARHGGSTALHVLAARIDLQEQHYDAALAQLRAALALDATDAQAHGVTALALFDSNRPEPALQASVAALQLDGEQHEALLVAGTLALWNREWLEAQALFECALVRFPNSGRVLSGLGQCLMLRNELLQAQAVLEQAVQAMPEHIGTWHALAWTQLLQGDSDAAYVSYQQAYALDRNFADTHGGLGLIAVLRDQHAEAEASIERALRLDRNSITGRYARSLLLQKQGDTAGSEALLSELLEAGGMPGVPVAEFAQRLQHTLSPP
ncbi:tetratricopeptide repeat protein [uncultured Stenotrophomonas sp.]|uniref:tetratricopeptide repeat protein n=1 Tax=uncultured Stenotrophomonas sp. TaxID=165438 RepID=UPI0028D0607C|nr:tetratricopeptide repeat protein [uncultured Stenotrophomonas sp.]